MISWFIQGMSYGPHRPGKWEREKENITNTVIWKDGKLGRVVKKIRRMPVIMKWRGALNKWFLLILP